MSETPRTDEYISPDAIGAIPALCRQLERENAALREQLVELAKYKELIDRVSSGEIPNAHPSWSNVVVISKETWASYEDALEQLAERDAEIARLRGLLPDDYATADMEARAAYPKE